MLEELELLCEVAGIRVALYDNATLYPWLGAWSCVEYKDMIDHIKKGAKYQVRILKQIHIEGYGVDSDTERNPGIWMVNPGL